MWEIALRRVLFFQFDLHHSVTFKEERKSSKTLRVNGQHLMQCIHQKVEETSASQGYEVRSNKGTNILGGLPQLPHCAIIAGCNHFVARRCVYQKIFQSLRRGQVPVLKGCLEVGEPVMVGTRKKIQSGNTGPKPVICMVERPIQSHQDKRRHSNVKIPGGSWKIYGRW